MKIFNKFLFSILFVAGVITAVMYGFSYTISEIFRTISEIFRTISEIFRKWNEEIYGTAMSLD